MKRPRRRKCHGCDEWYRPDYRNLRHQHYCSKPECRLASKQTRQRKWRGTENGRDYFRGPEEVERVQEWRKTHPGYSRRGGRKGRKGKRALQDDCSAQRLEPHADTPNLIELALQDDCWAQPAFVVGLMSSLTGSALQDDIAGCLREINARGQEILGINPGVHRQGEPDEDRQTARQSTQRPKRPPTVQPD